MGKIASEKNTIELMIQLYCHKKHRNHLLCADCESLKMYALKRLDKCPFGDNKPACKACNIHCYHSLQREKIREVMRYSGPRMLFYYPFEYFRHKKGLKIDQTKKK